MKKTSQRNNRMPIPSNTVTRFSESVPKQAAVLEIPTLTILCHPDTHRVGERSPLHSLLSGGVAELSRHAPRFAAPGGNEALHGLDISYVSRKPLRLSADGMDGGSQPATQGGFVIERRGSTTPVNVDGEPLDKRCRLSPANVRSGVVLELGGRIVLLFHPCPSISAQTPRFGLVGDSGAAQRLRQDIVLAASTEAPVLLRGASGTGKELVARAVHGAGKRRGGPWVAVNMAAIPPSLAAAELFGSRKGAFTGAAGSKAGYFLAADGGTLFLDEIGDTPAEVQPLLLRALDSGEIQPVGSAESRRVDVRVIAATDSDLEARLGDGSFRTPLFHRLAGFEIRLPSLAERRDDVGRLLVHFLERELGGIEPLLAAADTEAQRPWPPASLVARLAVYDWPGNVRQLANVARRLAIARRADHPVDLESFVESLLRDIGPARAPTSGDVASSGAKPGLPTSSPQGKWRPVYRRPSEVSDDALVSALRATHFELTPAAEALGISRAALYKLIERCPRVRKAGDLDYGEIERALVSEGDEACAARSLEVSLQGLRLRMKALGLR